ncbi:MAG: hypothetical protein RLZZ46_1175 [Bacteroidota bacterium]|jgi:chemotaxis protein methyltransferase CheR
MTEINNIQIGEKEAEEIISAIYDHSGFDFLNYSQPSLIRRFQRYVDTKKIPNVNTLLEILGENPDKLNEFIEEITVNVTEMFRDPYFFKTLREKVLPELKEHSPIRIWHAGCSTGEEVYSLAILLKEENLLQQSIIYATDINQSVLDAARRGAYSEDNIKLYGYNYKESESKGRFEDYYEFKNGEAVIIEPLKEKIIFSSHNLVSDGPFNKFDLVVCRNVLIYFNKDLQNNVLNTFYQSLNPRGFLALGSKENIMLSPIVEKMETFHSQFKVWRRKE